jgi:hypothetical protein
VTLWRDRAKGNARDGLFWLTVIERDRAGVKPKLDWATSILWAAGDVLFFERRVLRSYQFGGFATRARGTKGLVPTFGQPARYSRECGSSMRIRAISA